MSNLHPLTRHSIKNLALYAPFRNLNQPCSIDLSGNINYFAGCYQFYPDIYQSELKHSYLDFIWKLDFTKNKFEEQVVCPLGDKNVLFTTGAVDACC